LNQLFTAPAALPPALDESVATHSRQLLMTLPGRDWDQVCSLTEERLVIEGHESTTYAPSTLRYRLVIRGPAYVELPMRWEAARIVRLSSDDERAYLATRLQPDDRAPLSITWTIEDSFYFAACHSIESLTLAK
jgi:hypothetical protein